MEPSTNFRGVGVLHVRVCTYARGTCDTWDYLVVWLVSRVCVAILDRFVALPGKFQPPPTPIVSRVLGVGMRGVVWAGYRGKLRVYRYPRVYQYGTSRITLPIRFVSYCIGYTITIRPVSYPNTLWRNTTFGSQNRQIDIKFSNYFISDFFIRIPCKPLIRRDLKILEKLVDKTMRHAA